MTVPFSRRKQTFLPLKSLECYKNWKIGLTFSENKKTIFQAFDHSFEYPTVIFFSDKIT